MNKVLIITEVIALIVGISGAYVFLYLPQTATPTVETETWHFVTSFTTNETSKTSPLFHIEGEKWRIQWKITWIEKQAHERLADESDFPFGSNMTLQYIKVEDWTGLLVNYGNGAQISVNQIDVWALLPPGYTIVGGRTSMRAYEIPPEEAKGTQYVTSDEGDFYVEVKGIANPVVLTIESYY